MERSVIHRLAALALTAVLSSACETAEGLDPLAEDLPWITIPRDDSRVFFAAPMRQGVIFTELRGNREWRQERLFLLSDTYDFKRSQVVVTLSRLPLDPAFVETTRDLARQAAQSHCDAAVTTAVRDGSNTHGPFLYQSCQRKRADHCTFAAQEIPTVAIGPQGTPHHVAVEWLYCTAEEREADILARFASLRFR